MKPLHPEGFLDPSANLDLGNRSSNSEQRAALADLVASLFREQYSLLKGSQIHHTALEQSSRPRGARSVDTSQAKTAGSVRIEDKDLHTGTRTSSLPRQRERGPRYYHQENRTINPGLLDTVEEGRHETTPGNAVMLQQMNSCLGYPSSTADFPPVVESEILPPILEENFGHVNNGGITTWTNDNYPTPASTGELNCGMDSQGNKRQNNNNTTAADRSECSFTQVLQRVC